MSRTRLNINREWKFLLADVAGAEQPDFDDSQWERVGLPHTFDLPYFRTPEFYVGVGWYRKRVFLPLPPGEGRGEGAFGSQVIRRSQAPSPQPSPGGRGGKRVFLEFEGAFQVAEILINGTRVGEHRGGYTGFHFDITDFLGESDNLLAVRVDNSWNPQLCPRAGEHIFSGGLYRDVHLLITHSLRFAPLSPLITTSSVSTESATIAVKSDLDGDVAGKTYRIRSSIIDPHGRIVATGDDPIFECVIPHPLLWHPDHPHLYRLHQNLFLDEILVDTLATAFGIRFFEWTPDRGFFLNGEHLYLRGANVHQDHAGWGIGITQAACERDVRLIKEAGFNFVRGAHYPHHPAFADACDRLGLIFWSENCFWGKGGFGPEGYWNASAYPVNEQDFEPFEQHCKQTLAEMIRINRNHPSIVVWSMTNEAFFTYNLDRARNLMRDLVKLSHELDPTRPAAIGGAQRGDVDSLGDIAGYNGDGARLFIDPGVPNMVSEYGAITKPHDAYDPFFGELQQDRFPWRAGEAIWAGFDYGSIAGRQGLKGILRHDRLPKRSWHWYRDRISPSPGTPGEGRGGGSPARLLLSADKTTITGTDATDDAQIIVTVCDADGNPTSISPPVTLTIERGPGEFPTGRSITFDASTDIPILAGQAAIAFRSYESGESLIRATSPDLSDATIAITTTGEQRFIEGITPLAASRIYSPPPESEAAKRAMRNAVNVALNRPCRASSESTDHPARLANDGLTDSCWQPQAQSVRPWWLVDLEGFYQLSSIRLVFESAQNHRYLIESSQDGTHWIKQMDRTTTTRSDAIRNDIFDPGTIARYVRATFESPVRLCELEIHGILSVR